MKKLYRFYRDFGRMGSLEGTLAAREEAIQEAIGRYAYFGEVLGKHSNVHCTLKSDDFMVLTDDQDFIEKAEDYGLVPTGYNPLSYLGEDEYE